MPATMTARTGMRYQPILDLSLGVAAGYQATAALNTAGYIDGVAAPLVDRDLDGLLTASTLRTALATIPTLPPDTFLSLPIGMQVAAGSMVRSVLRGHGDLAGIILDIVGFAGAGPVGELVQALSEYRAAGAMVAVGGHGAPQPELTSIVRLKPAIIRLGRDWVRGIDRFESKRSAIEVIGQRAGQLDARILAEGVSSPGEVRVLAGLGVPLAQGPFIGQPASCERSWPEVDARARTALPRVDDARDPTALSPAAGHAR